VNAGDYSVNITDDGNQFQTFLNLTGVKRIVSFGGWGYSTDPASYATLRTAMADANRDTFVNSLKDFATKNKLDGIDIDWEYPGEVSSLSVLPLLDTGCC
jgi:GH18 family chitinase